MSPNVKQRLLERLRRRFVVGYTIVEVLMAMAVLSVGATGVIAMQKTALLGNLRARNLATASQIASNWIERLRTDGIRWRRDALGNDTIANTAYLNVVLNDYPTVVDPEGLWIRPAAAPDASLVDVQPTKDVRGMDTTTAAEIGFCTNIRLTQILPNMIRAEVRVFWPREQGGGNTSQAGNFNNVADLCDADAAYLAALGNPTSQRFYHFVYMTSTIIRHDDN